MAAHVRFCVIPGCNTELSPRSSLTECPNCRASLVSWLKRRPAEILDRRRKLTMYEGRMRSICPGDVEKLEDREAKVLAPSNYKPQSRRGKAVAKQTPRAASKRAHAERIQA